jgi:hypothetical protein
LQKNLTPFLVVLIEEQKTGIKNLQVALMVDGLSLLCPHKDGLNNLKTIKQRPVQLKLK